MTKPMSDGGKGSVRRNEDNDAYRNNFDNIFGARAPKSSPTAAGKKEQTTMTDGPQERSDEDYERSEDYEDEEHTCPACNGSGEGMYDGSTCYKCGGTGEWMNDRDDDIGECYDIDD